jgi:hypothetical protein
MKRSEKGGSCGECGVEETFESDAHRPLPKMLRRIVIQNEEKFEYLSLSKRSSTSNSSYYRRYFAGTSRLALTIQSFSMQLHHQPEYFERTHTLSRRILID